MKRALFSVLMASILFFSCATDNYGKQVSTQSMAVSFIPINLDDNLEALTEQRPEYRIDTGDVLSITVYRIPELTSGGTLSQTTSAATDLGFSVDEEGYIQFPIVKKVKVAGLTRLEAARAIETSLRQYIKDPDVILEIKEFGSKFYYITGASARNGKYPITPTTTILEAVSFIAPIQLPNGAQTILNTVYMKRNNLIIPVSISDLSKSEHDYDNLYLKDGDIFFVPSSVSERVYILGEVPNPGAYSVNKPDYTVMDLIAEAGGVDPVTADKAAIYLVRQYGGKYQYAALHYDKIIGGDQANDLRLIPGDRLIVSSSIITDYNRILQQILPTFQAADEMLQIIQGGINIRNSLKP